jgi:hypothetical protein
MLVEQGIVLNLVISEQYLGSITPFIYTQQQSQTLFRGTTGLREVKIKVPQENSFAI